MSSELAEEVEDVAEAVELVEDAPSAGLAAPAAGGVRGVGSALHARLDAARLLLDCGLHVLREVLRLVLDALELRELRLPVDVGLDLRDEALGLSDPLARLAGDEREPLGPEDDKRDDADDHHLAETEVKHGGSWVGC